MAVLKIEYGRGQGTWLPLRAEPMTMGRHPSNAIVLDSIAVSRKHAQLDTLNEDYTIEDLNSRNGTIVNGSTIEGRTPLRNGDEIRICDVVLRYFDQAPAESRLEEPVNLGGKTTDTGDEYGSGSSDEIKVRLGDELSDDDRSPIESSSIITRLSADDSGSNWRVGVQSTQKLKAILGISRELSHVLGLNDVLSTILAGLFDVFVQAEEGFIMLRDPKTGVLRVRATRKRSDPSSSDTVCVSMAIVSLAAQSGDALLSANAAQDIRFRDSESFARLQIRSFMCAPIISVGGETLGIIQLSTYRTESQFEENDLDVMAAVCSQAGLAINNAKLHEQLVEQTRLQRDLVLANEIQTGFLPEPSRAVSGFDVAHLYEAALKVGGDYYDHIELSDGRLAVAVGDVAGKGVPAALLMARLFSMVRYEIRQNPSPGEVLQAVNSEIFRYHQESTRMVTMMIAIFDREQSAFTLASAGHPPGLLKSPDGSVRQVEFESGALPLGILEDQKIEDGPVEFPAGHAICFYTDGITEAIDEDSEIYGTERMVKALASADGEATDLVQAVFTDVREFTSDLPQRDDMCVICVRRP